MQSPQFQVHAELEQTHWWFTARRRIIRSLVEALVLPSKEVLVVEVGCGTGGNVAELSSVYACVGIDINLHAIDRARAQYPGARFICGEAPRDVEVELQKASIVLLLDVLEHVRDDFQFLSQLLASVRPGCYVVVTVPADQDLWTQHDVGFGHFRRYDMKRLEATWEGTAVSSLVCSFFNSRLYWPIKWIRRINLKFGRTSGSAGTDFFQPLAPLNWLLHRIFVGEARALTNALTKSQSSGFRRGVSLVAVLRRESGEIPIRSKPAALQQKDFSHPEAGEFALVGDEAKLPTVKGTP